MSDEVIEVVNQRPVVTVRVYPDGEVDVESFLSHERVPELLRDLATVIEAKDSS